MINSIVLEGNLTTDAQMKIVGTTPLVFFRIANTRYISQGKFKTLFRSCEAWGSRFEALVKYLVKGKRIIVSGYEEEDEWVKDEEKKVQTIIKIIDVSLGGITGARMGGEEERIQAGKGDPREGETFRETVPF